MSFEAATPRKRSTVAVIGCGAAGLVAARELHGEGHNVVVFERGAQPGGTWVYTPHVESDPLGLDPGRAIVHSSLYSSLRTNLPRELMGFSDFPFVATGKPGRDSRRYPGHQEVLRYLEDFALEFRLNELVRYQTEVRCVGLDSDGKWRVSSRRKLGQDPGEFDETYDAVVVCVGHYTEPRIANIPGVENWPGRQIHSHNYRIPEPYQDQIFWNVSPGGFKLPMKYIYESFYSCFYQVVVLIGSSASAVDISRDIAGVAKEVHVASRSNPPGNYGKHPVYDNMWLHPMIERAHEDGRVTFQDGNVVVADVILHCTGYKYHFPFLEVGGEVNVDDNGVGPLYKHVFPPGLAPGLSFVSLPFKLVPFILFELQSKWIAGVLSGPVSIPSKQNMMEDVESFYSKVKAAGIPKRYAHQLGDEQFMYDDWLAAESGCPPVEEWKKKMYSVASPNRVIQPETYLDEWDDDELILEAHQHFLQYLKIKEV